MHDKQPSIAPKAQPLPEKRRFQRLRPHRSIRFRITALFVAIFGSTLIAFSIMLYSAFISNHQTQFDAALYNHALDVAHAVNIDIFGQVSVDPDLLSSGGKVFPFSADKAFLQIISPNGQVVARSRTLGSSRLPFDSVDLEAVTENGFFFRTISRKRMLENQAARDRSYRLLTYQVRDRAPVPFILQVAVPLTLLDEESRGLLVFFLVAIPLTLVVAAIGGWYLSASALAPVAGIIEKARRMSSANLSERLPIPAVDDEIRQLSTTLNGLLERLQQAFESQERFIADASHELKTPLAIMRGELDVLRHHHSDPHQVQQFIESASQEIAHLSRMVEDLLILARVDAGSGSLAISAARIDEILLDVISRLEARAKERRVKVKLDLFAEVLEALCDPVLLQSLFQNLIENAIKFSPPEAAVEVTVRETPDRLVVSVRDHGPGIPEDSLPKIFDRFYRVKTPQKQAPGFGLGLAIARRVADAHGATLEVSSSTTKPDPGTEFRVGIKKL